MMKDSTDLRNDKISSLLFKISIPAIIAQLVNVLYNIVDRIFIGRIENGALAMAGLGVAFPIILIVAAFSALIGLGGAPLAAIKMGEGKNEKAEEILSNSFSSLVIISLILTILVFIFKEQILWAFGASNKTIDYSLDYLSIYIIGTVSVQIALGLNAFINTQGFSKIGMKTVLIGAIVNIILDPIFIFGFHMGVKGAALATILAQTVSAFWVLRFLTSNNSKLRIKKVYLIPKIKTMFPVIALGISPFIMNSTESLVLISLNNMLMLHGGDLAVSAMTIMSSIMQIILLPLFGLAIGAQPIISYNYGAKQLDRVRETFGLFFKITIFYTTTMWVILLIAPGVFVSIFSDNPELMKITTWSIRIYFAGIFAFGAQIACQQTFLALGKARVSLLLALLRKIILLIPLIFILPQFMENKLLGVLLAEPIADIIAATATTIAFMIFYKKTLVNKLNNS